MSEISAVIFDMDGVLFEGRNFWLDLHRRYGTEAAGVAAADRYLAHDYSALASKVVGQLWKGKPAAVYEGLVRERKYQARVMELFDALHRNGMQTAIVSSGPDILARRAQHDLGIDLIRANGLEIVDGVLTGRSRIEVPDANKERVGMAVMRELGVTPATVASVGDTESDVALAELVAVPIAYDSSSRELERVAMHILRHGQLGRLIALLGLD